MRMSIKAQQLTNRFMCRMKTSRPSCLFMVFFFAVSAPQHALAQAPPEGTSGGVPVRILDPQGSHCIDASTEKVTLYVRRFFTERDKSFIAKDGTAIATVTAQISGNTQFNGTETAQTLTFPSIGQQQINDYGYGRISVPLEYSVASELPLSSKGSLTSGLTLDVSLVKTRTRTAFSGLLNLASQALTQLPIPPNPYTQAGSKILAFANQSVATVIQQNGPYATAHLGLSFADHKIADLSACEAEGHERTGAILVMFAKGGGSNGQLLPVTNIDQAYCLSYSSAETYEATYAQKNPDGSCPKLGYKAVPNDYLMFLLSADPTTAAQSTVTKNNQSAAFAIENEMLKLNARQQGMNAKTEDLNGSDVVKNLKVNLGANAQVESIARCKAFNLPLDACGVQLK